MSAFPKYDRYKDSGVEWLGEIPEHWELLPFQGLFDMSREKNEDEIVGEMLSISGLRGVETKRYESDSQKRTKEQLADYRVVRKGQLAVNTMWLNYAGLGVSDLEGHMSPAYRAYDIRSKLEGRYAHHLLRSFGYVQAYTGLMQGIRPNSLQIKNDDFKKIPILVPPKPEQDRIVTFLDRKTAEIDALIAKKQRQIELLDEQKAILINRAVTRGLNPNAKLKPSGIEWIGEIPQGWDFVPLKRICKIRGGFAFSSDLFGDEGIQLIRIGNLYANKLSLDRQPVFLPEALRSKYKDFLVKKGDILMSLTGTLGKRDYGFAILLNGDAEYFLNQRVAKIDPTHRVSRDYLTYFLWSESYLTELFSKPFGTKQANLANEDVLEIRIPLPPPEEQTGIVAHCNELTAGSHMAAEKISNEIESLKTLRSTLIAHAVTGRIKVA